MRPRGAPVLVAVAAAMLAVGCDRDSAEPATGPVAVEPAPPPLPTTPLAGVERIAVGFGHGCALTGGRVFCWGTPAAVAGAAGPAHVAAPVPGLSDVVDVRAGGRQTCALDRSGALRCWGERIDPPAPGEGNVAVWNPLDGPPASFLARYHAGPVAVGLQGVRAFDVGRAHACAIDRAGALGCWGSDANHEIGAYALPGAPHRVAERVAAVRAGVFFTCFRPEGGDERCLGVEPAAEHRGATFVDHTRDPIAATTCSLRDRRVRCTTPGAGGLANFPALDAADVRQLTLGAYHACALRADASVWCWGENDQNQLGRAVSAGTGPAPVAGLRARQVGAGISHTCAVTDGGSVVCWGAVDGGAIGVEAASAMTSTPAPQTIHRLGEPG